MLILTRKENESIEIDGGIKIVVLDVYRDRVRIGVEAPLTTRILRSELLIPPPPQASAPAKE
jgi:carbon storage regulator